jgi:phosphoglycolate phosphatase-like HAD superfamily hydrolase
MPERFVLFDFDGVLTDSFRVCFETAHLRCPHLAEEEYRDLFEGNINERRKAMTHTPECRLDMDFFSIYTPRMMKEASVIEGMAKAVRELSERYGLVIISSTLTASIKSLLDKFGLADCFAEVLGSDIHSSKADKIRMVMNQFSLKADGCIFVTDTLGDINEAAGAGVASIAVSWGFHGRERLERGKPFRIVDKPEGLALAIDGYFRR